MKIRSRLTRALAAVLLLFASTVGIAPSAGAATGNILPPFNIGEQWWICQGYNNPAVTHHDNGPYATNPRSMYGLDLTSAPGCHSTASAGKTVRTPLAGTATYSSGSGTLCINSPDGRSIALTHIDSSVSGAVSAGQEVGTVAAAGYRSNGGIAHIHLQIWSGHGCWATGNGGMPFDGTHNARICGAPDLTSNGPNGGNGTWSGESFTGASCQGDRSAITAARNADGRLELFAVGGDGNIYSKVQVTPNGAFSSSWNVIPAWATDVAATTSSDGRIELFYVGNDGVVWHRFQTCQNCNFSSQQSLGGSAISPAITATRNAELFYTALDGSVRHRFQTAPNGAFGSEAYFGGSLISSVSAERNADGRVEVFAIGGNGHIYSRAQQTPNGAFSPGWNEILSDSRDIASVSSADGRIELLYIRTNRAVYQRAQTCPNCIIGGESNLGGTLR